jgi:hypothetical protein
VIVIQEVKVVEIAAHLAGRTQGGIQAYFLAPGEGREDQRQHAYLDLTGEI